MIKTDFNSSSFAGFRVKEDILLDTGIILAYLNRYDSWHSTVIKLFNDHILDPNKGLFLYINPCILNEIVHLSSLGKPIEEYLKKHPGVTISPADAKIVETQTISSLEILIQSKILLPLDGTVDTYLNQLKTYKSLGSADAFNASLANEYGINFLTIDNKLVNNIMKNQRDFNNIDILYYTNPSYKT